MDSNNPGVETAEYERSYNRLLATANFLTTAYSDNEDLHGEHQQNPFIHTRTRPIPLHVERREWHMPQVPSNPTLAYSGNEDLSRKHQQIPNHIRLNVGKHELGLHMSQVPSNPTEARSGNDDLSREYNGPPVPLHVGRYELHQTYMPYVPGDPTDETIRFNIRPGNYGAQGLSTEYDTTARPNISALQTYAEYASVVSPQYATFNSEDPAQEISRHNWQYYDTGITPYYPSPQISAMITSHTLIKPPNMSGFMLFPSPANSLPRIDSFSGQNNTTAALSSTENYNTTSFVDQNKPKYQNWLVSEGTPFASRYYSNQTGAEYVFNGTTMGNFLRMKPDLFMVQTDSKSSSNMPTISSVCSVQESYSISGTHSNIETGLSQFQPPPDSNETVISQQSYGNSQPDISKLIEPSPNISCEGSSPDVDIHQRLIDKIYAVKPRNVSTTTRNKETGCSTLPGQQEMRRSTKPNENNKLCKETSEVACDRLSSILLLKPMGELRRLCWVHGLKISGPKKALVNRLLDPTHSSKTNDQTRLRTIHLWLKRIGATSLQRISRCLCSAIEKGFLNMMSLSKSDVIAKGECPQCRAYMEATVDTVLHQPDNPFQKLPSQVNHVDDLLKCPNCSSIIYVTRMCQGVPEFTTPEKHHHCMQKSMFGGCEISTVEVVY